MKIWSLAVVAASATFLLNAEAEAATLSGDTVVAVTAPLDALGISAEPLADSTFAGGVFTFPISGGALDSSLAGEIEHDEAGVRLFDASNEILLEDFVIDTVNSEITALVTVNSAEVGVAPIFEFDISTLGASFADIVAALTDLSNPQLSLTFTSVASMVIVDTFGLLDAAGAPASLEGVEFGLAATAPIADVPVPAAFGLFAFGAAALGWARRRKAIA
ncbi:MAG: PEP-CTERM sorting domain-containing protein [Pseudomonadota bacterium]